MRRLGGARRALRCAIAAAVVATVVAGCGGGDGDEGDVMDRAERALDGLDSGVLTLVLRAQLADTQRPVGFSLEGPFDLREESAALSFTSTRWIGDTTSRATLSVADGVASITVGGTSLPLAVPPGGTGEAGGESTPAADLRLSRWIDQPVEEPGQALGDDSTTLVTGELNVGAMADDLARLAATVDGSPRPDPLDDASADRLAEVVRSSSISILVDNRGVPRRLQAEVDFGADVPPELAPVLRGYAGLQLHFELAVDSPNEDVDVPPPSA